MAQAVAKTGFPSGIKYIVGNEAAERFSFYGMRSILVIFMVQHLRMTEADAKGVYHLFVSANYFLPLFGAYLADRYLGKYPTIMSLSLVYCLGHLVLAVFETQMGLYAGLTLIAIGAGGIKPCVSAHVGDQFDKSNSHLLQKIYEIFYFSINFGSFFATMIIPVLLVKYGPSSAFGLPGVLMGLATWIFWMGRNKYIAIPPSGKEGSSKFWGVLAYSLSHLHKRRPGQSFIDVAAAKYDAVRVDGAKAAINIFKVFIFVIGFWALFDQHGSTWVLQAGKMDLNFMGYEFQASQIQSLNPIMVMIIIPLFSMGVYPMFERRGIRVTPLRRMGAGMLMTGLSFVAVGVIENVLESGTKLNVIWQVIPYLILTAAEVLVSITGLEFAYTQAPRSMKSTIMSLWLLTIAAGNFLTAAVSKLNPFDTAAMEFYFYAVLCGFTALLFIWSASRYKERNYIESAEGAH